MKTFEPTKRKLAMISQPMNGLTDEEIEETRERAIKFLKKNGYKVANTLFTDDWYSESAMKERGVVNIPIYYLAKSLENMSLCDVAYFCDGWEDARGCRIEHEVAEAYDLDIIYAVDEEVLSEEQLAFMKGLDHAEEVLEEYFDLVQNAWSGCAEEYKRSAKILKNGAIRWVHGAQFQKAAEFLEGAEVE